MRNRLNTLFVLSEDVYLSLEGENVVVLRESETVGRFPLHTLEGILCFSYKGASPTLMGACEKFPNYVSTMGSGFKTAFSNASLMLHNTQQSNIV